MALRISVQMAKQKVSDDNDALSNVCAWFYNSSPNFDIVNHYFAQAATPLS